MCGSKNTSTTSTTSPNPQAMQAYTSLLGQAQNVAQTPFTPYGGEFVAPVNQQQQTGIAGINANANYAQPYIGQAAQYANNAAQPITATQIAQYQSPYTQQVVDATQKQFNQQNAQQQSALLGNAAAQGALGGDRVGVAQANLATQQQLAQAPLIAGLYNQGYQNAQQMALTQQQAQGNAAYSLGNLGVAGQGAALSGAGAQIGAGSLEQQTQQAQDAALYQQFLQQQAYPFQTTQWLAGIDTGVGSQMGGTSTTTPPPPNPWNTALGLGTAALAAFARDGGRVRGFALGGTPYGDVSGYVPTMQITGGQGAPKPPGVPGQQASNGQQSGFGNIKTETQAFKGLGNLWNKYGSSNDPLDLTGGFSSGEGLGSIQDIGSAPEAGFGFGPLYAKGGMVGAPIRLKRGFDDGGPVTMAGLGTGSILPFDDRWAPVDAAVASGEFDPQGSNATAFASPAADAPIPVKTVSVQRPGLDLANDDDAGGGLPPLITRGTDAPAPPAAGLGDDEGGALAYDRSSPTAGFGSAAAAPADGEAAPSRGGLLSGLGLNLSPNAKQALLAAGFGLMASRSPYLGQAIGEAGLQGIGAYSSAQKEERAGKKTEADIEHGRKSLEQQAKLASDRIAMETKKLQAQQEHWTQQLGQQGTNQQAQIELRKQALEEQKRQHDMSLKAPVKIGEERNGAPIMALPRLGTSGNIDYYRINRDGTISDAPIGSTPAGPPTAPLSPGPSSAVQPGVPSSPLNATQPTKTAALNTGEIVTDAPPPEVRAAAPPASPQARDEQFIDALAKDDPQYAKLIKGIASYQVSPAQFSLRNNRREKAMGDVLRYDPTYDQRRYNQTNRVIAGWAQSPEGRATRSLSTTIEHLGTAEELGQALRNGDTQALNRISNWAKTQMGYEGPPNFEFAKQIVADEIAKAVIGGTAGEGDRRGLQAQLSQASSPEQLAGVVRTAKQLMAGQIVGLQHTYETATGLHNFNDWLTPRARSEIERANAGHAGAPQGGAPGGGAQPAPTRVRQNGHTYERQQDGSYKAID